MRETGSRQAGTDLKAVTLAEIEQSITQAQYTVFIHYFRETRCPSCQNPKEYRQCFCKRCYFALPDEMRAPLWTRADTPDNLKHWIAAYIQARNFLTKAGIAA